MLPGYHPYQVRWLWSISQISDELRPQVQALLLAWALDPDLAPRLGALCRADASAAALLVELLSGALPRTRAAPSGVEAVLRLLLDCLTPTHSNEGGGEGGEGGRRGEGGEGGESEGGCSGGGGPRAEGGSPLCDASARGVLLEAGVRSMSAGYHPSAGTTVALRLWPSSQQAIYSWMHIYIQVAEALSRLCLLSSSSAGGGAVSTPLAERCLLLRLLTLLMLPQEARRQPSPSPSPAPSPSPSPLPSPSP